MSKQTPEENLSPAMRDALSHMAELERLAALRGICSNAVLDGTGRVSKGTAKALVRRDLAEHVAQCPFGADWPEVRLTERGRLEGARQWFAAPKRTPPYTPR